jgi:hypothetical protein
MRSPCSYALLNSLVVCRAACLLQELLVHCEQQVLRFVMSYLSTTAVEPHDAAAIWGEVSNSCKPKHCDNSLHQPGTSACGSSSSSSSCGGTMEQVPALLRFR